MRPRWVWCAAALIGLSCLLYYDTFSHEFSYDDFEVIVDNPGVQNLSNLSALVSPSRYFDISSESSFRPVVTLAYFAECAMFGLNPAGFHAVNILLHGLCAVLLGWIGLRLGLSGFHAVGAAALFLAHPVATESVNAVAFLDDILCLLFLLLSLVFALIDSKRPWQIAAGTTMFMLALLSKETALLFPAALWVILKRGAWDEKALEKWKYAMAGALVVYTYWRFALFKAPGEDLVFFQPLDLPPLWAILTMVSVFVNYIRLFFVPIGLSAAHVVQAHVTFTWVDLGSLVTLAGLVYLLLKSELPVVRWGGLWCLVFILPVSQLVVTNQISSDRFLYIPLAGACLALASAWDSQFEHVVPNRWLFYAAILLLAALTWHRNPDWKNHAGLFELELRNNPQNAFANNAVGVLASRQGRFDEAGRHFKKAIENHPGHSTYIFNLGNAYFGAQRYREAAGVYEYLAARKPKDGGLRLKLAWCLWMTGQIDGGRAQAEKAKAAGLYKEEDRNSLRELETKLKG